MEFDLDAGNVAHIARHGITPEECEEAYWNAPDGDRGPGTEARAQQAVPGGDQRGQAADVRDRRTQGQDPVRHRAPDAHETTADLPGGGMMPAKTRIPAFQSEKEKAAWWDAHAEVFTALCLKAKKEGKIKRLPVIRGAPRPTTIRLPIADIETAQQIAERRGLPYQTYLKGLLHQALEDRKSTRLNSSHANI